MKLQSRIQVEDFVHDIISLALPHIEKSNIRPAYQKTKQPNPAGKNVITYSGEKDGLTGFTNEDNFVYFFVDTSIDSYAEGEVTADNDVSLVRLIPVTVYFYGSDSSTNAIMFKAYLRSLNVQHYMNFNGYYQYDEGSITPIVEDINGEWWERNDFKFTLTCLVEFDTPKEDKPQLSKGVETIVFVDSEERGR